MAPHPCLFFIVLFAMTGCSALERVQDCNGLAAIVNDGLEEVRFEAPDAGDGESYERIAAAYEDVGKRIAALAISDANLEKAVVSYREVIDRAAKHSRSYAQEFATAKKDRRGAEKRLERIRAQAKSDVGREAAAIRKINALCHPH